ncbi:MAG: lipocalin family protein [Victivallaceae bacterium]
MKYITGLIAAMLAFFFTGCTGNKAPSTAHIPAVEAFSASDYMGTWYEIARLPHSFEKDMDEVTAQYTYRPDGTVEVINSGVRAGKLRSIKGTAKFAGSQFVGELKVSFFWPFYGDYRIIYLEPNYRHAIVTSKTMDYLWILSRTPTVDSGTLQDLLAKADGWGFHTDDLEFPRPKK